MPFRRCKHALGVAVDGVEQLRDTVGSFVAVRWLFERWWPCDCMDILLGVGGSELSYQALEETLDRVQATGDDLTVAIFDNEEVSEETDTVRQRVEATLQEVDFEASIRTLDGDAPGSELISLAENEGFDRIVLGGGERSTLGKIQLGSIVEFVLLNAQTPVTLIR